MGVGVVHLPWRGVLGVWVLCVRDREKAHMNLHVASGLQSQLSTHPTVASVLKGTCNEQQASRVPSDLKGEWELV